MYLFTRVSRFRLKATNSWEWNGCVPCILYHFICSLIGINAKQFVSSFIPLQKRIFCVNMIIDLFLILHKTLNTLNFRGRCEISHAQYIVNKIFHYCFIVCHYLRSILQKCLILAMKASVSFRKLRTKRSKRLE